MTPKQNSKNAAMGPNSAMRRAITVLLIEDEDILRSVARRFLEMKGFIVLEAATLQAARKKWAENLEAIQLVLTDVQLPDGHVRSLAREFRAAKPDVGLVLVSGYPEQVVEGLKDGLPGAAFVQKPFDPRDLLKVIDAVMQTAK